VAPNSQKNNSLEGKNLSDPKVYIISI